MHRPLRRLADLARRTGRSKTFYARQAIEQHLEDLEDLYLADLWRYRVGDYRIVADVRDNLMTVMVVRVAHCRESYR